MQVETRPVSIAGLRFGGPEFVVIAGPCAIESLAQFSTVARAVKSSGAAMLRGGIYKLRTDPRSFQGLGSAAFDIVRKVRDETGLPIVSELTDPRQVAELYDVVDVFQIGARNMHNYSLLKEVAATRKPTLLKRGISAKVEEWLLAAEYLCAEGNNNVILCERGIRTFESVTRNTLDLSAVSYVKHNSRFPVIVDPSHGVGVPELIGPMCLAAAACGADGLILEVHHCPERALSDAQQALTPEEFGEIIEKLRPVLSAVKRSLAMPPAYCAAS
jgi:3-deoxy-7-phosphoheptulonate synthase